MILSEDAFAKINLTLDITGKRSDGYHLLRTVMQSVSLCDRITLEDTDSGNIHVRCNNLELSCGPDNTVFRAAQVFFEAAKMSAKEGILFTIDKKIPWQAGLGGGSTDAAAALRLLNRRFQTGFCPEQLCEIGLRVGADVPFCVLGGTALAEGIGEKIHMLPPLPGCFLAICKPPVGNDTKKAYARIDTCGGQATEYTGSMLEALKAGDVRTIAARVGNAFESTVSLSYIYNIKKTMLSAGSLGACMTGSGTAVFGIFSAEEAAVACVSELSEDYAAAFLCRPVLGKPMKP
jgi:4-diphosphocytidyl-2-C-methyl-D-erythritol kinase